MTGGCSAWSSRQSFCENSQFPVTCCSFRLVLWSRRRACGRRVSSLVEMDDGADALAFMHQIKRGVDVLKPHRVGDEIT